MLSAGAPFAGMHIVLVIGYAPVICFEREAASIMESEGPSLANAQITLDHYWPDLLTFDSPSLAA